MCAAPIIPAAVLAFAARGLRIVPLHSVGIDGTCTCKDAKSCPNPGKHPRIKNWIREATTDRRQLDRWSMRWPGMNWGCATGRDSRVAVLDIDPRHGGSLRRKNGVWCVYSGDTMVCDIPATARVHTTPRGGWHVFLAVQGKVQSSDVAPGVELKGDSSQVVMLIGVQL